MHGAIRSTASSAPEPRAPGLRGEDGGPVTTSDPHVALSVLLDAVETYYRCVGATGEIERRMLANAERWFASEDRSHPVAFLRLCELLRVEPGRIRELLRRRRAEVLSALAAARAARS